MHLFAQPEKKAVRRVAVCPICSHYVVGCDLAKISDDDSETIALANYIDSPTECPKCFFVPSDSTVVDVDEDGRVVDDDDEE